MAGGAIDFRELDDFINKAEITKTQYNDFIYRFLVDMGELIVSKAKEKTPVDTGALKASWGLKTEKTTVQYLVLKSSKTGRLVPKKFYVRSGHVTRVGTDRGKYMGIRITNPQEYATEIEDGFVKSNGDWYEGRHMLKSAMNEMQAKLPAYYEVYFYDFKRRNGLEG